MRTTIHRAAAPIAAATAAVGLALFGVVPTAQAADPPPSSNQGSSSNLVYKKSVVGSNVVHPGDTVTYKLEVSKNGGVDRYVTNLKDFAPAGFTYVSGSGVVNKGANITVESDGSVMAKCTSCTFGGFSVGGALTFQLSYKVPANAVPGVYDSGLRYDVFSFGTTQGANPFNVKVQVVPPDVQTSTSLTVPATAVTGTSVDLTANLEPAGAVGTVQFKDNGVNIGSPVAVAGGHAVLPHTFTDAGAHAISADFVAGAGFVNSSASAQTVQVSVPDVQTSTSLTVPATAVTGTSVDVTANLDPAGAVGTVQFKDNGVNIGSPVAVAGGHAVLPHTFTDAGAHAISADFVAGAGFVNSSASAQTVQVSVPDVQTSTSLTVPADAVTGTAVNLLANVGPAGAVGTVQFKDNGTDIGSPVVVAGGVASLSHTFDAAGVHSITADFHAGSGYVNSSAEAKSVTVTAPSAEDVVTTTSLTPITAATKGQQVTLKANVHPSTAHGTVQFKIGTENIGAPVPVVDGVATLDHTFTATGAFAVTAEFTGAAGFTNSAASAQSVTVTDGGDPGTPGGNSGSAGGFGSLENLFGS